MKGKIYQASAGSGKTYQLVLHYLQYALQSPYPDVSHILALTFTNKATYEMKERILNTMAALAGLNTSLPEQAIHSVTKELCDRIAISEKELHQRALSALRQILHRFHDFHVLTIDKFFNKIIQTFAADFYLSSQYNIEPDAEPVIEEAVEKFLLELEDDNPASKILIDFIARRLQDEKDWDLRGYLKDLIIQLKHLDWDDPEGDYRDETLSQWQDFKKAFDSITQLILQHIGQMVDAWHEKIQAIDENHFNKRTNFDKKISEIKNHFTLLNAFNLFKIIEKGNYYSYFKKAATNDSRVLSLIDLMEKDTPKLLELISTLKVIRECHNYFMLSLVISRLYRTLQSIKHERNILFFDDLHILIKRVTDKEPAPFIYERLGNKFQYFLIDEFQDTSTLQWNNLQPLIIEALSKNENSEVMLVGDTKQSIYRFRGGEPQQMNEIIQWSSNPVSQVYTQFTKKELIEHFKMHQLSDNRRSALTVVEFNNNFFDYLKNRLFKHLSHYYQNHSQNPYRKEMQGLVEVMFFEKEKNLDEISDELPEDENNFSPEHLPYLEKIYQKIAECIEDGFNLQDIAILTPLNEQGKIISEYLLQKNIPVISSESLTLDSSINVKYLIAALKYSLAPHDKANRGILAVYLQLFYSEKCDDDFIVRFTHSAPSTDHFTFAETGITLSPLQKGKFLNLYDWVLHTIEGLQLNLNDPYLITFLNLTHDFAGRYGFDTGKFLKWWEELIQSKSINMPGNINAVRIMSIHKSKGLEFPVTIVSHLGFKSKRNNVYYLGFDMHEIHEILKKYNLEYEGRMPGKVILPHSAFNQTLWQHKAQEMKNHEMLDAVNLTYVALTRPRQRLYVLANLNAKSDFKEINNSLSEFCMKQSEQNLCTIIDKHHYVFGERKKIHTVNTENQENEEIPLDIPSITPDQWKDKLKIAPVEKKFVISGEAIGRLLHACLEKSHNRQQCLHLWKAVCRQKNLPARIEEFYRQMICQYFDHPVIKKFYEDALKIYSEFEILYEGEIYRPDKLIETSQGFILLDFKTGQPNDMHKDQLLRYKTMLESIGKNPLQSWLVYFSDGDGGNTGPHIQFTEVNE